MSKEKALVLGGTAPHSFLVRKLKMRGFYVILLDYLDNPPAQRFADEFVRESTLDKETVLRIAKENHVSLVISTCIDQANITACYVSEKLGLSTPYSYETSLDVTNKGRMKRIMMENQIPTSRYFIVGPDDNLGLEGLVFPLVVKPVDCNSSMGVHRVDSEESLYRYVREALALSRTGYAIVEKFNEGIEIQVDCFAAENDVNVLMIKQKQKICSREGMVLQSFGSIIPASISDKAKKQVYDIARKITSGFQLRNTPFFYQAIVNGDEVCVLEFAPRIGGGLSYYLLEKVTGCDIIEMAIDSFLNISVKPRIRENHSFYSSNILYMEPGIYDRVVGFEELKEKNVIIDSFLFKKRGDMIDSDMRSSNRICAFIVEAENMDEIKAKSTEAFRSIQIFDTEGNDKKKKIFYCKE